MQYGNPTGLLLSNALTGFPYSYICHVSWGQITSAVLVLTACILLYWKPSDGISAPFVGYRSPWEPPLLVQIRYTTSAASMISEGYTKWKDSMYKISRYDGNLVVLSPKYLDDLHNRPPEQLSAIHGLIKNFGGCYSGINLLVESDVGTRALQAKITPNLAKLCDAMRDELEHSLHADLSPCKDWTSVPIQPFLLKALGRMTNRIFVGLPLCRDSKWIDTTFEHADNVTMTQIAMRTVPTLIQPLLNLFLPSSWKYKASIRAAKRILIPEVQRRRQLENYDDDCVKPNDLLQAMIDMTNPEDKAGQPEDLAHRMLIMTAVAGHSTAAAGSHALFDLIANPGYVDVLREEALQVLRNNGMRLTKQALGQLVKMDSFIKESQRCNPPSLLGFHRVATALGGITLHDGIHIPHGTHLCVAPYSISSDPAIVTNPDSFDGLRYYEQRRQGTNENTKYQLATADKTHLHFGYGTWSCPGRFLASDELKMLLTVLLIRYDFQYPGGTTRPANGIIHEFPYLNIETTLLVKRRLK